MLEILKKIFRIFFMVMLFIFIIGFPIAGWTIGGGTGQNRWNPEFNYGSAFLYGFLGLIIGFILAGIFGGLVATILSIDERLERVEEKLYAMDRKRVAPSEAPLTNVTPINTAVIAKDGNAWVCKECKEENPLSSTTCKSCGAYK